jgi:NAD(P)-dependent dehydrogenase (short-subunit alcohol dehydrogenase family)
MGRVADKIAVVTGAAAGIGRANALALAHEVLASSPRTSKARARAPSSLKFRLAASGI